MSVSIATPQERAAVESFIAERFRKVYGAQVSHFCAQLIGFRDGDGRWHAAAGYTPASAAALFLEQYLDVPVEDALAHALGVRVARSDIVEVGNLAAVPPGFARRFVPALGAHLRAQRFRWAVFTATREVRNLLRRLCFRAHPVAPALPSRLPAGGAAWGTYYAHDPSVMVGRLA